MKCGCVRIVCAQQICARRRHHIYAQSKFLTLAAKLKQNCAQQIYIRARLMYIFAHQSHSTWPHFPTPRTRVVHTHPFMLEARCV